MGGRRKTIREVQKILKNKKAGGRGMYIAYFDESGDDGYPKYSSDLTSVYMDE